MKRGYVDINNLTAQDLAEAFAFDGPEYQAVFWNDLARRMEAGVYIDQWRQMASHMTPDARRLLQEMADSVGMESGS